MPFKYSYTVTLYFMSTLLRRLPNIFSIIGLILHMNFQLPFRILGSEYECELTKLNIKVGRLSTDFAGILLCMHYETCKIMRNLLNMPCFFFGIELMLLIQLWRGALMWLLCFEWINILLIA